MKTKKGLSAIGLAAVVGVGFLVAHQLRKPSDAHQDHAVSTQGVVNPGSVNTELVSESPPQLLQEGVELLPSMGTGSYTEPAASNRSENESAQKGEATR